MIIAVDFDGTCVTHEFPRIGKDIGAQRVLKKLVQNGHQLILWTIRSGNRKTADVLVPAVEWFEQNGILLFGVNEHPHQKEWSMSPKAYANLYIDDAALGCPLITDPTMSDRPYVDWAKVEVMLQSMQII